VDGYHSEGPLPNTLFNESVVQYSTIITVNYTIRISNKKRRSTKKDDCVIISSNIVCIVKNILTINGEIFLVCSKFDDLVPLYDLPCSSISVGSMECKNISSDLQLYHISDVKYKACYFPTSKNSPEKSFFVCALLHIYS